MKFLLLIALLLIHCNASGKDYLDYYQGTARAEAAAVHGAYSEALASYDSAFAAFLYNNPIDLYVAAQIAGFIGQPSRAENYILKGISFGLPLQTVQTNPHLKGLIREKGHSFQRQADSCVALYRSRISIDARKRMIGLIRFDQRVIRDASGSIYNRTGRTLKSEYQPIWDSLLRELICITKQWGFSGPKIIGTQNGDDSLFRISPGCTYAYFILVHHGDAWLLLKDLLSEELKRGNITPQMYGAIADNCDGHDDYTRMNYFAVRPCEAMVHRKRCTDAIAGRMDAINDTRSRIGLCTYEVATLKWSSSQQYYSWQKKGSEEARPLFDYQVDLNQW